jgi:multimeric flavodoxin WrbA
MQVLILNDCIQQKTDALDLLKYICDEMAPPHQISWVNIHDLSIQPCAECLKSPAYVECHLPEDDAHRICRIIFSTDALVIGLDSSLKNLSPAFKILLDRCVAAMTFQNGQSKTSHLQKGRPAVVVPIEKTKNMAPEPSQGAEIVHDALLQFLELGGFEVMSSLSERPVLTTDKGSKQGKNKLDSLAKHKQKNNRRG